MKAGFLALGALGAGALLAASSSSASGVSPAPSTSPDGASPPPPIPSTPPELYRTLVALEQRLTSALSWRYFNGADGAIVEYGCWTDPSNGSVHFFTRKLEPVLILSAQSPPPELSRRSIWTAERSDLWHLAQLFASRFRKIPVSDRASAPPSWS